MVGSLITPLMCDIHPSQSSGLSKMIRFLGSWLYGILGNERRVEVRSWMDNGWMTLKVLKRWRDSGETWKDEETWVTARSGELQESWMTLWKRESKGDCWESWLTVRVAVDRVLWWTCIETQWFGCDWMKITKRRKQLLVGQEWMSDLSRDLCVHDDTDEFRAHNCGTMRVERMHRWMEDGRWTRGRTSQSESIYYVMKANVHRTVRALSTRTHTHICMRLILSASIQSWAKKRALLTRLSITIFWLRESPDYMVIFSSFLIQAPSQFTCCINYLILLFTIKFSPAWFLAFTRARLQNCFLSHCLNLFLDTHLKSTSRTSVHAFFLLEHLGTTLPSSYGHYLWNGSITRYVRGYDDCHWKYRFEVDYLLAMSLKSRYCIVILT